MNTSKQRLIDALLNQLDQNTADRTEAKKQENRKNKYRKQIGELNTELDELNDRLIETTKQCRDLKDHTAIDQTTIKDLRAQIENVVKNIARPFSWAEVDLTLKPKDFEMPENSLRTRLSEVEQALSQVFIHGGRTVETSFLPNLQMLVAMCRRLAEKI